MLEAKKPRVSGKAVWTWITVIAFVGLLIGIVAYAANPDGTVTIMPDDNGDKHVWGVDENISYTASCSYGCVGECNTGFGQTSGLTAISNYDDDSMATVSGTKSSTGTYDLGADCPSDCSHGMPSQSFKVADINYLTVDSVQKTNGATVNIDKAATGYVTIEAILTPTATLSELPSGFVTWTKTEGTLTHTETNQLTVTVPKTTAGAITLEAQAGEYGTVWTVTIVVEDSSDGTLTISPLGNSGSDVWGANETISYGAFCEPCEGEHDTGFDVDAGLTLDDNYDGNAVAFAGGTKATTGYYVLEAECPDDGSHGEPSRVFKVVDIDHLSVDDEQQANNATVYVEKADTGVVTIDATLTPGTSLSELRPSFMDWTKTAGTLTHTETNQLSITVPKTTAGTITVTCQAGPNGTEWTVTIVVCITKTITVSRHPECTLTPATVTGWLNGATALMPDDDGDNGGGTTDDVDVWVRWTWNGTINTFATYTDTTYNDINSEYEAALVVTLETTGSLLVVTDITDATGMTPLNWPRSLLEADEANARTFAHEYGHQAGLQDRTDDTSAIMYDTFSTTKNEFNATEAAAIRAE